MRLPSRHEAFIRDKTEWISDKFFTQQRLAGPNPMSLKKVTIHGEGRIISILLYATANIYRVGTGMEGGEESWRSRYWTHTIGSLQGRLDLDLFDDGYTATRHYYKGIFLL